MTVSVSSKTYTFTNGTANDAAPVDSEFTALFNNCSNIKTKVDNLLGGAIEDGTSVTVNSLFAGSPSSNISFVAERGSSTNTAIRWNETDDRWEVTNDGTNYTIFGFAGASDPSSLADGFLWYNTTDDVFKGRINGSTKTLATTDATSSGYVAKTTNYTVVAGDARYLIDATSGTWTLTLTAAATLGSGFTFRFRNTGTGIITIDPNSSETVDGNTTIKVYPGEAFDIVCDGSNFKTVGRQLGWVTIQRQTASTSASLDFTTGLDDAEMDRFELDVDNYVPSTDATALWLRVSLDAGSTYKAGGTDYVYAGTYDDSAGGASTAVNSTGAGQIVVSYGSLCGSSTGEQFSTKISFANPANGSIYKSFTSVGGGYNSTPRGAQVRVSGMYVTAATAINAVRLLSSSGNMASGTATLRGYRK